MPPVRDRQSIVCSQPSHPVVGTISGTAFAATIRRLIVEGTNEAPLGVTIPLKALATYDNNAQPVPVTTQATWSSSNPAVATVDSLGVVSGVATGDAVITATFSGLSTQHSVRYRAAELVSLEIVNGAKGKTPINGTTVPIYLVDDVSYPSDPEGLSPNAYYPVVYAKYSDGTRTYVNDQAFVSSNQDAAYVNWTKGSFVFGRDLAWRRDHCDFWRDECVIQCGCAFAGRRADPAKHCVAAG